MLGKQFYVYALCHPNGIPFYIGKGQGRRVFKHEAVARTGEMSVKSTIIREILEAQEYPLIRILFASDDHDEIRAEEQRQIEIHSSHELVNVDFNTAIVDQEECSRASRNDRLNIQLKTTEEQELLREIKILAMRQGVSLKTFILEMFKRELGEK